MGQGRGGDEVQVRRRAPWAKVVPTLVGLALVLGAVIVSGPATAGEAPDSAPASALTSADLSDAEDAYANGVVSIDLGDPASLGSAEGVTYEDGTVSISAAGVYSLSGALDGGSVEVDTKGKVYLELSEAQVSSDSGPALSIVDSKQVTLILAEGTTNSLADGITGDADSAALLSNDTLVVTGGGVLVVKGSNGEGIRCDDDIVINSGTITVDAVGDGIAANDDITINGGEVSITARGDGLDSNGTVHVNGGTVVSFGGTAQGEGGLDARGPFTITGGTVVAGGNAMVALSNDSRQPAVYVTSNSVQPEGTTVRLERDGEEVFAFTPEIEYQTVLVSSDALTSGVTYQGYLGETSATVVPATG